MTTVVTGSTGHVGSNLVRTLLKEGRDLRAVTYKDTTGLENIDVPRVEADVTDYDSLVEAFRGAETVFHLVAKIDIGIYPWKDIEAINVLGVRNVVKACQTCGVKRLVHFSSIHAYDPHPFAEVIDETRQISLYDGAPNYDRSKAMGELEIMKGVKEGLNAVIVNPTAILGPHDFKPSHMGEVLIKLYHRKLPSMVKGGFNWVDVRDVVAGAMAAEKQGRTGEKYLLSGHYTTMVDLCSIVEEVTGVQTPKWACPPWLAMMGAPFSHAMAKMQGKHPQYTTISIKALQKHALISHAKATRELGYQPRPLKDTLADTYAWYIKAGMLKEKQEKAA